ncbi:MAG: Uma2 family endonuclease [Thermoanaerobaculia bacterium]|nr:Uma2 family endonuclease [Thermoanaerobaculia bacterium]
MVDVHSIEKVYTISEYLAREDASEARHEFHNGTLIEMAGGILPHNMIKLRLAGMLDLLLERLKMPHVACNSDTKVRLEALNRFVYPDVTISDGQPVYYRAPEGNLRRDAIVNPLLIAEVLSEDTRAYDKSEKFENYCTIPGFREYVLIEPETVWVKRYFLQDPAKDLWHIQTITDRHAVLTFESLGLEISLDELYAVLDKLSKE